MLRLFYGFGMFAVLTSCQTWHGSPQEQDSDEVEAVVQLPLEQNQTIDNKAKPTPTKSEDVVVSSLQQGEVVELSSTLPRYTPFWIEQRSKGKIISRRLAFKAWDFDHNGRFDMLEVLDKEGRVSRTLYDFDLDGIVDQALANDQSQGNDSSSNTGTL